MEKFKKKSLFDIYFKMTLDEVIDYYQRLRQFEYDQDDKVKGIQVRKALYQLVKLFLFIDEIISRRKITIIGDERSKIYNPVTEEFRIIKKKIPKDRSKVYSCTHIGRYDIESVIKGLNESCNFVMADPGESYQNLDGIFLRLYGVTWFDMSSSMDRHAANIRELKILSQGGNELVFPEAAYNLDPIEVVGKLHPGPFIRTIRTNSYAIPVSLEQYVHEQKKDYVINIGNSIETRDYSENDAEMLAEYIRKQMIILKNEIWSLYGGAKPTREEYLSDPKSLEKYKDRIDFIMRDVPSYYSISEIVKEYYAPTEIMVKSLKDIGYLR